MNEIGHDHQHIGRTGSMTDVIMAIVLTGNGRIMIGGFLVGVFFMFAAIIIYVMSE